MYRTYNHVDQDTLFGINALMGKTTRYKDETLFDFERVILPAIELGQTIVFWDDGDRTKPTAFATWAWLDKEATNGYISRTRLLQPEDFPRTGNDDQLFIIDFVCLKDVVKTVRYLVKFFSETTDAPYAIIARSYGTDKVKRLGIFKRKDRCLLAH